MIKNKCGNFFALKTNDNKQMRYNERGNKRDNVG